MRGLLLAWSAMAMSTSAAAQHVHGEPAGEAGAAVTQQQADPHAGHDMAAMEAGDDEAEVGSAPAPAPPTDHAADAIYGADAMRPARAILVRESGYFRGSTILFDRLEYQAGKGSDGYVWEAEAWYGGDLEKVVLKTEGEGTFGSPIEEAEVQLLYARAVAPYWNAHLGLRHDIVPNPSRSYAVLGIEGVAPYWIHLGGQAFLSDKGDLGLRVEASYDQRLTQRLVLAPSIELDFAAADVPELAIGSGLSKIELGLRLRYEIARKFAPYVGVERARKLGDTARYARADGEDPGVTSVVAGVRFWF